jgi:hypothetical protein
MHQNVNPHTSLALAIGNRVNRCISAMRIQNFALGGVSYIRLYILPLPARVGVGVGACWWSSLAWQRLHLK